MVRKCPKLHCKATTTRTVVDRWWNFRRWVDGWSPLGLPWSLGSRQLASRGMNPEQEQRVSAGFPWSLNPASKSLQMQELFHSTNPTATHGVLAFLLREKSNFYSRTIAKVWFSTFNYETGQHRPSNCQNQANLALGVVLKVILHFLKKLNKSN